MANNIDKLTEEQERLLHEWRDRLLKAGLSCEPANREAAEHWIDEAYKAGGLPPPELKIWVSSPWAGCVIAALLIKDVDPDRIVGKDPQELYEEHKDLIAEILNDQLSNCCYGQHDLYWLGTYQYIREVLKVDSEADPGPSYNVALNTSWWWPMDLGVVICDRPEFINRDEQHRLHNTEGPAVRFRDGWSTYAIHGVRVPERYFKGGVTSNDIAQAENAEVRRVLMELYGVKKYLNELGAKLISSDVDTHNNPRELYHANVDWLEGEPLAMVLVINSTPEPDGKNKHYTLRVSPKCKTPREALASMWEIDPAQYDPVVET